MLKEIFLIEIIPGFQRFFLGDSSFNDEKKTSILNATIQYIVRVFKSGLSKFFKSSLPQNLPSPLLNTLSLLILKDLMYL